MFITRLEMIGFKSFASRTQLEFRHGVMAVVGPNGCGKTNIVDAIRWSLGEQRTGTLRADRMEAVIFNGTARRRPLGMAEVSLTIDNDKGLLPAPFSEVAVTRRLFRSGESEYLINRNPSRLRDINDLFTDTGFGSHGYSIMELPMVEGIITGPSESRRILFEEAAGISRYKARRHAAEGRLATTRENLLRIEDIYSEVEKQFRSLKRQASRARRYQLLTSAIKLRLIAELAEEHLDLQHRRQPLEAHLVELEEELQKAESDGTRATSELLSLEGRELSLIDRTARTQDALKRLDRREAELEGELALVRQRISFLETERAESDHRRGELVDAISQADASREASIAEVEELKRLLAETETSRTNLAKQTEQLTEQIDNARHTAAEARHQEEELGRELKMWTDRLQQSGIETERLKERLSSLRDEQTSLNAEIKSREQELAAAHQQNDAAARARSDAATQAERDSNQFENARQKQDEAFADRARAAAETEAARATLNAHRARSTVPTDLPESLRELISREVLRTVTDRIQCRPEHRAAIAAALSPILEALDRPDLDDAVKLARRIEQGRQTTLRFPVELPDSLPKPEMPPENEGCIPGRDLALNDGELGNFLRRRLSDTVLVPDIGLFPRFASWAAERGVRLVTLKGELLEPDGVIYIGAVDPNALQVSWSTRQKELEATLTICEKALSKGDEIAQAAAKKLKNSEEKYSAARKSLLKAEDAVAEVDRRSQDLEASLSRCRRRSEELKAEIERIQPESDRQPDREGDDGRRRKLEKDHNRALKARQTADDELQALEHRRLQGAEDLGIVAAEAARLGERLLAAERGSERYAQDSRTATDRLAALDARLAEGATELERVSHSAENIAAQLDMMRRERADIDATLEAIKIERHETREARDRATSTLNRSQEQQKSAIQERSKLETDTISLRERQREVDRRLVEDADLQPGAITPSTPAEALSELSELGYADLPLEKLKIRLQSIGPVNMLALEELKEVEQRYHFLTDQRRDLENGIEVLEETIDRINSEARRRFRETFDQINNHFQDIFRTLFEGGDALLSLQDGDPLEADIRIWATPVGKKLQVLSALSGGEKALTAIALLFAIYRAKPSPFCVLDEVDAPLDDANVVRFNKLIQQYTGDTQFLIVTHNKRTMEAADCLYGVTLGEDGTSRMVSVKFEGGVEPDGSEGPA